jgi:SAM-dependent methyltransferase
MSRLNGFANVRFCREDILKMGFKDNSFDHVFVCFVLEHLLMPEEALLEFKRILRPGGTITVIEGDHGSCFWYPQTEASMAVWHALIRAQKALGHDPLIGRRLHPLLDKTGYGIRYVEPRWVYTDGLKPELADGVVNKIIVPMVISARKQILEKQWVKEDEWRQGIHDLEKSSVLPGGSFFYTWFKAMATSK